MDSLELKKALKNCRVKLFPTFIASAEGFFKRKTLSKDSEVVVAVCLAEGCTYDDIADVKEWLMGELEWKLAKGQTIEFYWQLLR